LAEELKSALDAWDDDVLAEGKDDAESEMMVRVNIGKYS
jgi:hypothetical protein